MRPLRSVFFLGTLVLSAPAFANEPAPSFGAPELVLPGGRKPPSSKISLALEDADLSELMRSIGAITGKRFVVPNPKLRSLKATLYSPEQVTVEEAYQAFLAVLHGNGLTVVPKGAFFEIVEASEAGKHGPPITTRVEDLPAEERFVTHLHRLSFLSADEVTSTVLSKLQSKDGSVIAYGNLLILTDAAPNVRRMLKILEVVDVGGAEDHLYLQPLYYQPAADLEKRVKELFELKASERAPPAGKGATPAGHGSEPAPSALRLTKIVAVDRPNSLLILAPEAAYLRLLELVKRLDVPPEDDTQVHVISLQHVDAKKIIEPLNAILTATAAKPAASGAAAPPGEGAIRATADESNNALLVHCARRDYPMVLDLVRKLDQPKRQVYIEAVILDLTSAKSTALDVSYHAGAGLSGDAVGVGGFNPVNSIGALSAQHLGDAGMQALALGVAGAAIPGLSEAIGQSIPGFGMFLSAIETSSDTDIVSSPHIMASDNMPAEIKVQLNTALQQNAPSIPALASSAASGLGAAAAPLLLGAAGGGYNAPYGKIGPRIKITPHVNDSDQVRLDVDQSISDLTDEKPQGTLGTVSFVERSATTTLTVRDHETVVIGGLVRDRVAKGERKIPILGDIPIVGALFRSRRDTIEKSNLVLVLTPHIIRDQVDMRRVFERKMQERQEFLDHVGLFRGDAWEAGHSVARAGGLLSQIHKGQLRAIEDQKVLEDARSRTSPTHEAQAPLDVPAAAQTTPAESPPAGGGELVHNTAVGRSVLRIEP